MRSHPEPSILRTMGMNRSNRSDTKRRFQLFRGNGEAERLDRLLAAADPLAMAAPKPERRKGRSDRRIWSLSLFLAAASLATVLWLSWSGLAKEPGGELLLHQKQAQRLVDQGRE